MILTTNKLHLGDNLDIMKSLPTESIDLIYCDPPFNSGVDYVEFDDKWDSMKDYLNFMTTRIKEIHRLLKKTGSFYLHCDPTSSHYLKVEVDKIFGIKQFRNEIVWKRFYSHVNLGKYKYYNAHDIILFYIKLKQPIFNQIYIPIPETTRRKYNKIDKDGRHYFDSPQGKRRENVKRCYLDESKGISINSLWIDNIQLNPFSPEQVDYPTQKPIKLLDRIIQVSSEVGNIVLDPFYGSGTALVSANQLGRYYIGIDENPKAISISSDRLQQQNLFTLSVDNVDNKEGKQ